MKQSRSIEKMEKVKIFIDGQTVLKSNTFRSFWMKALS